MKSKFAAGTALMCTLPICKCAFSMLNEGIVQHCFIEAYIPKLFCCSNADRPLLLSGNPSHLLAVTRTSFVVHFFLHHLQEHLPGERKCLAKSKGGVQYLFPFELK